MNAGIDDGVPASILRDVNLLKMLKGPWVQELDQVEMTPNLVKISSRAERLNLNEFMAENRRRYFADEKVHGFSSIEHVGLGKIREIVTQIVSAVAFCHEAKVVHRNLKTDNVLLGEDGRVKLMDFSQSRPLTRPKRDYSPEVPKERQRSGREEKRTHYKAPEILLRQ